LKESKPDLSIRYLIAGKGPFEPNLRDLVRELELEEQVEFLGFIAREDVNLLYSATDLFVMPSVYLKDSGSVEGFGWFTSKRAYAEHHPLAGPPGAFPTPSKMERPAIPSMEITSMRFSIFF
jgi:phosphatidylinositol alpha-1,6-mannosyltransferase